MSYNNNACPVPFDQQPLNEYKVLKQSLLFTWSTNNTENFIKKLLMIFCAINLLGIISSLIVLKTMKLSIYIIIYNTLFALMIVEVLLIRLYLGWSYILKRLCSATIFYEESGWYDGQLWIKSIDILTQDRLIGLYQVKPLLARIKNTFAIISSLFCIVLLLIFFKF
jgi:hypothetical protein